MPRKREPVRGLWEREPGSDIWWIRYRADGVLKREKVRAWGAAKELLDKRKNEIREGDQDAGEHAADLASLQDLLR